ncbi:PepSY domain-containing protein [Salipiger abyssi]|uniref:Peptidase propeptide and YPEB domain-containing protein n=1 Tax=Salipiger abyssi TaxID=1250539 RepID=A0A1P8UZP0_9RHOB|nr:PepSY domain-containing protein [Salipiger abyssi]APZ54847.1 Peptidase propeptide and YPEB domain-containing protein [Salipiger abyssi]
MTKILAAALAALTLTAPAMASPDVDADTAAKVREKLTAEGYEVRRIDNEDGMIEVYALKDGARLELYLDAELNVVRSKTDD